MNLSVGTSGYSYKEWLGKFYPDKLPAAQRVVHGVVLPRVVAKIERDPLP